MRTETSWSSQLLPSEDLYGLYEDLGVSLMSRTDLSDYRIDVFTSFRQVLDSVNFLVEVGLVKMEGGRYFKPEDNRPNSLESFQEFMKSSLLTDNLELITSLFTEKTSYDDFSSKYFVYFNDIPLRYAGLIHLMDSLGLIWNDRASGRIDLINSDLLQCLRAQKQRHTDRPGSRSISLSELKGILVLKEELGREAELQAIAFEKQKLIDQGIDRLPEMVSDLDSTLGYDIASYLTEQSETFDKYIEVKSCADRRLRFYLSKNEIAKAKELADSYFLYLYNRADGQFTIIKNPYDRIFANESDWITEPSVYSVQKLR